MDAQIPQLLDLLAAASSAGLSGQLALRRAVAAPGARSRPSSAGVGRRRPGSRWRDELPPWPNGCSCPISDGPWRHSSNRDARLLPRRFHGRAGRSVRAARRAAVTERARTAPVKMLFPLVFLVLPAFLLLTVVPVLLTTVQSIR